MLIQGRVIHSFGMTRSLRLAGLDADGRITEVRLLAPRRVAYLKGASWGLEVSPAEKLPPHGSAVQLRSET